MDILIPSYSGLGNSILLSPMIQTITNEIPKSNITIFGEDKYGALSILEGISGIKIIDAKDVSLNEVIGRSEVILLPRLTWSKDFYNLSLKKIKEKRVIGHYPFFKLNQGLSPLKKIRNLKALLKSVEWSPITVGRHEIDLNLDLAQLLANRPISPIRQTKIGKIPRLVDIEKFNLRVGNYICVQPSAANGKPTPKRWNIKNFELLKNELLLKFPNLEIVLLGDPGDLEVTKSLTPNPKLINLIGKTNLQEVVSILGFARVCICHDSGIGHICSALSVPTFVLWGPTDFSRTRPIGSNIQYLISQNNFSEMFGFQIDEMDSFRRSPNGEAMEGISVLDVLRKIGSRLNE
jgi:ADP-heptose:LPS heptosyltransferase